MNIFVGLTSGTRIDLPGMYLIAFIHKVICERLPDERVARVGLYQPCQVRKDFPDHAVKPDQILVGMPSAGEVSTSHAVLKVLGRG